MAVVYRRRGARATLGTAVEWNMDNMNTLMEAIGGVSFPF
jgi:hypothetical protein